LTAHAAVAACLGRHGPALRRRDGSRKDTTETAGDLTQDITGERADELMALCPSKEIPKEDGEPKDTPPKYDPPLFRLEGSGSRRKLVVNKMRGSEHHLEKVRRGPQRCGDAWQCRHMG